MKGKFVKDKSVVNKIAIIDFGGQYTHLICNKIRSLGSYSEVLQVDVNKKELTGYSGIIFSGGPHSVYESNAPKCSKAILSLSIPILGICYGHQLLNELLGGKVEKSSNKEYSKAKLNSLNKSDLLIDVKLNETVWMSHGDEVVNLAPNLYVIASTKDCEYAIVGDDNKKLYGLQFHPEVTHSECGDKILLNFLKICGCDLLWSAENFLEELYKSIRDAVSDKKVFMLVSGGVDSTVAYVLLNKALGVGRVIGVHIDNGFMRFKESEQVMNELVDCGIDTLELFDAKELFLDAVKNISDPQEKRKIIGEVFLDAVDEYQKYLNWSPDDFIIAQGTIYPDTIESGGTENSSLIKTHHNRVDKILDLIKQGKVIEPIKNFYKDEVRQIGYSFGLAKHFIERHPFPGPGLAVRTLCSSKSFFNKKSTFENMLEKSLKPYQCRILPIKSVGVQGDKRTYAQPLVLYGDLNWDILEKFSIELTNKYSEINRVIYHLAGLKFHDKDIWISESYLTKDRLDLLSKIDYFVMQKITSANLYDKIWQMPIVLLPVASKQGENSIVLRPINSLEAMTANFSTLPKKIIMELGKDIIEKFPEINAVLYDITHKPPGTIEWE